MEVIDKKERIQSLITDEYLALHKDILLIILKQLYSEKLLCSGIFCCFCPAGYQEENYAKDCFLGISKNIIKKAIEERLNQYGK